MQGVKEETEFEGKENKKFSFDSFLMHSDVMTKVQKYKQMVLIFNLIL
jgi:hypothetical protein